MHQSVWTFFPNGKIRKLIFFFFESEFQLNYWTDDAKKKKQKKETRTRRQVFRLRVMPANERVLGLPLASNKK